MAAAYHYLWTFLFRIKGCRKQQKCIYDMSIRLGTALRLLHAFYLLHSICSFVTVLFWSAWLTGVLPSHDDNESAVQEKCWEAVKSVILDNITTRYALCVRTSHSYFQKNFIYLLFVLCCAFPVLFFKFIVECSEPHDFLFDSSINNL